MLNMLRKQNVAVVDVTLKPRVLQFSIRPFLDAMLCKRYITRVRRWKIIIVTRCNQEVESAGRVVPDARTEE